MYLPLQGREPGYSGRPICGVVTMLTQLTRLTTKLLLALVSTVVPGSESNGMNGHILLPDTA